jgi:hypothetical protein
MLIVIAYRIFEGGYATMGRRKILRPSVAVQGTATKNKISIRLFD